MNGSGATPSDRQSPGLVGADEWLISLGGWIVQDGNYADFAVGTTRRFALEFGGELKPTTGSTKRAVNLGDSRYDVEAEVAYVDAEMVMLDFGLRAFREAGHRGDPAPGVVSGVIGLGVDPFFYFERHALRPGVPEAIYSWDVTGIWRQTAPYIPARIPGVGNAMVRDPDRLGWAWLDKTDAWADDNGSAEYLLRCRVRPTPPSRDIREP